MDKLEQKDIDRFWSKVDIKSEDECWEWRFGGKRYGQFNLKGIIKRSNRLAYEIANGPINNPALYVCHTCDNSFCCNPKHLYLGTQFSNMADKVKNDRSNRTLSIFQVKEIKELGLQGFSLDDISEKFNIAKSTASRILSNKMYFHLGLPKVDYRKIQELKNVNSK